jgi:RNA polymerase sigma-70 factor (ECF subfamily)
MIPTAANGQPAVADYRRDADGVLRGHAIHVLTASLDGVRGITVFLDAGLFERFGLPVERI